MFVTILLHIQDYESDFVSEDEDNDYYKENTKFNNQPEEPGLEAELDVRDSFGSSDERLSEGSITVKAGYSLTIRYLCLFTVQFSTIYDTLFIANP